MICPYTLTLLVHGDADAAGTLTPRGQAQMLDAWTRIGRHAPVTALASSPAPSCREMAVDFALRGGLQLRLDERLAAQAEPGGDDFATRVRAGCREWLASAQGSHRVLVTHADVAALLLADLLGVPAATTRLMTTPGGFAQLTLLEGHPAYLVRMETPEL